MTTFSGRKVLSVRWETSMDLIICLCKDIGFFTISINWKILALTLCMNELVSAQSDSHIARKEDDKVTGRTSGVHPAKLAFGLWYESVCQTDTAKNKLFMRFLKWRHQHFSDLELGAAAQIEKTLVSALFLEAATLFSLESIEQYAGAQQKVQCGHSFQRLHLFQCPSHPNVHHGTFLILILFTINLICAPITTHPSPSSSFPDLPMCIVPYRGEERDRNNHIESEKMSKLTQRNQVSIEEQKRKWRLYQELKHLVSAVRG